jgi:hypothetical protein
MWLNLFNITLSYLIYVKANIMSYWNQLLSIQSDHIKRLPLLLFFFRTNWKSDKHELSFEIKVILGANVSLSGGYPIHLLTPCCKTFKIKIKRYDDYTEGFFPLIFYFRKNVTKHSKSKRLITLSVLFWQFTFISIPNFNQNLLKHF